MALRLSDAIEQTVTAKLRLFLERFFRTEVKLIFDEEEAARFLCCRKEDLQEWRKRKLIAFARYPKGRILAGEEDGLGRNYTYSIAELLSFRERYLVQTLTAPVYTISREVTAFGPEVKKKELRAA